MADINPAIQYNSKYKWVKQSNNKEKMVRKDNKKQNKI